VPARQQEIYAEEPSRELTSPAANAVAALRYLRCLRKSKFTRDWRIRLHIYIVFVDNCRVMSFHECYRIAK